MEVTAAPSYRQGNRVCPPVSVKPGSEDLVGIIEEALPYRLTVDEGWMLQGHGARCPIPSQIARIEVHSNLPEKVLGNAGRPTGGAILIDVNPEGVNSHPLVDTSIGRTVPFLLAIGCDKLGLAKPVRAHPRPSKPWPVDRAVDALSNALQL